MRRLFFLAISTVSLISSAKAATIYSQTTPEEPNAAFSSNDTPTGQKVADNFILSGTGPITVRSIRFIGGYIGTPPPITLPVDELPIDNFRVVFLEDASGSPGAPVAGGDFAITLPYGRTSTGGQMLNGVLNPIDVIANLGNGITLAPDTDYWISITNDVRPDHSWAWARAGGVFDQSTAGTDNDIALGPWDIFSNGGMWFELNDQNVPEPTSLALLTVASVSMMTKCNSIGAARRNITDGPAEAYYEVS